MLSSPEIIGLIGLAIEANGFYSLQKKKVTESSWRYLLCLFLGLMHTTAIPLLVS